MIQDETTNEVIENETKNNESSNLNRKLVVGYLITKTLFNIAIVILSLVFIYNPGISEFPQE